MQRAVLAALLLCASACIPARPDSAVLIVVDTMRPDHLGFYGYARPTTPELDARAAHGLVFERAYSTSPWTLPAFGSLVTGHLPTDHMAGLRLSTDGSANFSPLSPAMPTTAELLAVRYWSTAAIVSNPFLHAKAGIARGFDTYNYGSAQRRAAEAVDAALAWIEQRGDQRFFLMLHLFDPHMPYDAPPPFRERFTGPRPPGERRPDIDEVRSALARGERVDAEFLRNSYDEEIAYVDRELGRFLDEIEQRGVLDRALVVLTADHGEEFAEHGAFEHGHSVYDEVVRVPLVLWGPGVDAGRSDAAVSIRDVPATLLGALGIAPPAGFPGRSLLGGAAQETVVAEHTLYGRERKAALAWPWKLHWAQSGSELALFDLSADPGERTNVLAERAAEAKPLVEALRAVAGRSAAALERSGVEIDPETRDRLRELGYLE